MITYKGVHMYRSKAAKGLWVWDEPLYGVESDDAFDDIQTCQDDIDRQFGNGVAPRYIDGEIVS